MEPHEKALRELKDAHTTASETLRLAMLLCVVAAFLAACVLLF